MALHQGDQLFDPAGLRVVARRDLNAPAADFGILAVHAEDLAGEQGGFVSAGAGPDLQHRPFFVRRIDRQQQGPDLGRQPVQLLLQAVQLFGRHLDDLGVGLVKQFLCLVHLGDDALPRAVLLHHLGDRGVLLGALLVSSLVRQQRGVGQPLGQFLEVRFDLFDAANPVHHPSPVAISPSVLDGRRTQGTSGSALRLGSLSYDRIAACPALEIEGSLEGVDGDFDLAVVGLLGCDALQP